MFDGCCLSRAARRYARRQVRARIRPRLPHRRPGARPPADAAAPARQARRAQHRRLRLRLSRLAAGRRSTRRCGRRRSSSSARNVKFQPGLERGPRGDVGLGLAAGQPASAAPRSMACSRCGTARARASTAAATCSSTPTSPAPSKHGGVLVLAGDDHAAKSSTLPHQSDHAVLGGDDPGALSVVGAGDPRPRPARLGDVALLGLLGRLQVRRRHGRELGRRSTSTRRASKIVVPDDFPLPPDGVSIRWPDAFLATEARMQDYKIYAALHYCRVNQLNRIVIDSPQPRLGIITRGKSYLDVRQALDDLGIAEQRRGRDRASASTRSRCPGRSSPKACASSPKAWRRSSSSRRSGRSSSTS